MVSMVTCFKIRARALWLAVLRTVSGVQFQWCSPETTLCGRAGLCLIDDPSRVPNMHVEGISGHFARGVTSSYAGCGIHLGPL